eukprot:m.197387 g.197387  ORF g.197387 m.197387 type:complete len:99 (+) comp18717_c0_seq2:1003-1299(+)
MLTSELKQLQQQRREQEAEKARLAKRAQAKIAAELRAAATTTTGGHKGSRGAQKNPSGGNKSDPGDGGKYACTAFTHRFTFSIAVSGNHTCVDKLTSL